MVKGYFSTLHANEHGTWLQPLWPYQAEKCQCFISFLATSLTIQPQNVGAGLARDLLTLFKRLAGKSGSYKSVCLWAIGVAEGKGLITGLFAFCFAKCK